MVSPALLFVSSRISFPELTDEVYNKWYDSTHVVDVLESGIADLALRYKNIDPNAKKTYLTVYRVLDVSYLQNQARKDQIPCTSGSGNFNDLVEMDVKAFVPIQTFEGQESKNGRGKGLLTVLMDPAEGGDDEFDEWYRKQVCYYQSNSMSWDLCRRFWRVLPPKKAVITPRDSKDDNVIIYHT